MKLIELGGELGSQRARGLELQAPRRGSRWLARKPGQAKPCQDLAVAGSTQIALPLAGAHGKPRGQVGKEACGGGARP